MKKTFFLIVGAAILCLSCQAHKISTARLSYGPEGGTIEAPANQVVPIINSLNQLPQECVERAKEILAAANPGSNTIVEIDCSTGRFLYKMRPAPRDMEVSVENLFPNKGINVVIYNEKRQLKWSSKIMPQKAELTVLKAGQYIVEVNFVGESHIDTTEYDIQDDAHKTYSRLVKKDVDYRMYWPRAAE